LTPYRSAKVNTWFDLSYSYFRQALFQAKSRCSIMEALEKMNRELKEMILDFGMMMLHKIYLAQF